METYQIWAIHLEFIILMITIIGGVYKIDSKVDRANDRIDKHYDIIMNLLEEMRKDRKDWEIEHRSQHGRISTLEERTKQI